MRRALCNFINFAFRLEPCAAVADTATVMIGWDKCPESNIGGYKIHYGTSSGNYEFSVDVGNSTSCTISGLAEGLTYYFAATSYTVDNIESEFSTELVHTISASEITNPTDGAEEVKIWIEAEDANINYPFDYGLDGEASSDRSLWVPNGAGNNRKSSSDAGYAEFTFEVSATANHVIWGRVPAKSKKNDSFYGSVDDGVYDRWDTERSDSWVWDKVGSKGSDDPKIYHLEAGFHTLIIKQREDGTKIDQIIITNDMNFIPRY